MEAIICDKRNHTMLVTLNRPDSLNAFNYDTLQLLGNRLEEIHQDRSIRCVVFRGEGKAFSAGADLKERLKLTEQEVRRNVHKIRSVFEQVEALPQPTIAAMHGYAFGGGFELALSCDFRYATAETKMGLTEVGLGIIPGAGGTVLLTQLVGKARAKELILFSKRLTAEEAHRYGIIQEVCEQDVLELALQRAEQLGEQAPLAVVQAKYAINKSVDVDHTTGMDIEAKAYDVLIPTEDRIEALKAFSEKRKPNFQGK